MEVSEEIKESFTDKLESYLSGSLSHGSIKEFAWELADKSPEQTDSNPFWSAVFSVIHLADEEHWQDGCTQRDLGELLLKLKASK